MQLLLDMVFSNINFFKENKMATVKATAVKTATAKTTANKTSVTALNGQSAAVVNLMVSSKTKLVWRPNRQ